MEVDKKMGIDVYEQMRIQALEHMGFCLSEEALIGHDGTKYNSYYVREV